MDLSAIKTPTLLLDEKKCRSNIQNLLEKADNHRVDCRPHFKTHQSIEIGRWLREYGVDGITVSSVKMAQYFMEDGWDDITIAFPVNLRQLSTINEIAEKINLTLFINSIHVAQSLEQKLEDEVRVQTEIDTGYQRSGIPHTFIEEIEQLLDFFRHANRLSFHGFYTHNGETYEATSREEIAEIHGITLYRLNQLRKQLAYKYDDIRLSIGDTPACSSVDNFSGIHSIHPGNFVFYDLNQHRISTCDTNQIAVALACPVVGRRPERNELILHGGAIHFSKDAETLSDGSSYYGRPVTLNKDGWSVPWEKSYLRSLSQEHGILSCSEQKFEQFEEGDLLGILPIHSCLTANLMGGYLTMDGQEIDHME